MEVVYFCEFEVWIIVHVEMEVWFLRKLTWKVDIAYNLSVVRKSDMYNNCRDVE